MESEKALAEEKTVAASSDDMGIKPTKKNVSTTIETSDYETLKTFLQSVDDGVQTGGAGRTPLEAIE